MLLKFYKYHGAGNDFIVIDNRDKGFITSKDRIQWLCDRHFGIGADGLMTLENDNKYDFRMHYFNSNGIEGTMCGNGGRCIVHFAKKINVIQQMESKFIAIDGTHKALIISDEIIRLEIKDVAFNQIYNIANGMLLDTGSPHFVRFQKDINSLDVYVQGQKIRYDSIFNKQNGVNVNFVEIKDSYLKMRTYERGVENETLACGTGAVAVALAAAIRNNLDSPVNIKARGGSLKVYFNLSNKVFQNIWLEGPVKCVFSAHINLV